VEESCGWRLVVVSQDCASEGGRRVSRRGSKGREKSNERGRVWKGTETESGPSLLLLRLTRVTVNTHRALSFKGFLPSDAARI